MSSEDRPAFTQPKPGSAEGKPELREGNRGEQRVHELTRPFREIPNAVPDNLISDTDPS